MSKSEKTNNRREPATSVRFQAASIVCIIHDVEEDIEGGNNIVSSVLGGPRDRAMSMRTILASANAPGDETRTHYQVRPGDRFDAKLAPQFRDRIPCLIDVEYVVGT